MLSMILSSLLLAAPVAQPAETAPQKLPVVAVVEEDVDAIAEDDLLALEEGVDEVEADETTEELAQ